MRSANGVTNNEKDSNNTINEKHSNNTINEKHSNNTTNEKHSNDTIINEVPSDTFMASDKRTNDLIRKQPFNNLEYKGISNDSLMERTDSTMKLAGSAIQNIANETKSTIDDNVFITVLKRNRMSVEPPANIYNCNCIYRNIRVFTDDELKVETKKYYKFPFNDKTRNDGSNLFSEILAEWKIALRSVYTNFKVNSKSFVLVFMNQVFRFMNGKITTEKELIDVFMKNDISFIGAQGCIYISGVDIALFIDLVINYDYSKKLDIPFILAWDEFENAINYKTYSRDMGVVKKKGKVSHCTILNGYIWGGDYKDLLLFDCTVNVNE